MSSKKGLARIKILSSSWLKIIAVLTMTADHAAVVFIGTEPSFLRNIGRIAFPLFAFMIGQGAMHTSDRKKYLGRLLIFAVISEIPFDLACEGTVWDITSQNVFFTLALGLISIEICMFLKEKRLGLLGILTTVVLAAAAGFLRTDYGAMGVIVCTLLYYYSDKSEGVKLIGSAVSITLLMFAITGFSPDKIFIIPSQKWGLAALIPLTLYNGEKGFKINKYFFYAYYPAHLLIFYLIKMLIA